MPIDAICGEPWDEMMRSAMGDPVELLKLGGVFVRDTASRFDPLNRLLNLIRWPVPI